ncbi:MAG: DNA-binding response regulator [Spirochaetes bacterium]|nr:MAG: DNA-binding response regulator [Spirochaetota bacterium]
MRERKSIIIIDDHPTVREGLKSIVKRDEALEIVGESGSGEEGLFLVHKLKPDLVLLDLSLKGIDGIEITKQILKDLPDIKVVIISVHSKINYIKEAFLAGAKGYIIKESAPDKLLEGIQKVLKGNYYMDSYVSHEVVQELLLEKKHVEEPKRDAYGSLSSREQQILRFLAEGMQTKEIASKLFISVKTVENHRANIMRKLNVKNIVELIKYAAKIGIIDIDLWKD